MGKAKRVTGRLLAAALGLMVGVVYADAQDDAIAKACPAGNAWLEKIDKLHPEREAASLDASDRKRGFSDPALRDELHRRVAADQAGRNGIIAHPDDKALMQKAWETDVANLAWQKPLFTKQGFPTAAQVGMQGVADAFLLVQHSDSDPVFQATMLEAIKPLARRGDVSKRELAMLTDRVLRHQGKPQRYGTQYETPSKQPLVLRLQPTEDEAGLDARRASMELMPRKDYECVLRVVYSPAGNTP